MKWMYTHAIESCQDSEDGVGGVRVGRREDILLVVRAKNIFAPRYVFAQLALAWVRE